MYETARWAGKKKTKKPKHDFQDHSESKSRRSETYGMLGLSALGLAAMTAVNAAALSSGVILDKVSLVKSWLLLVQ